MIRRALLALALVGCALPAVGADRDDKPANISIEAPDAPELPRAAAVVDAGADTSPEHDAGPELVDAEPDAAAPDAGPDAAPPPPPPPPVARCGIRPTWTPVFDATCDPPGFPAGVSAITWQRAPLPREPKVGPTTPYTTCEGACPLGNACRVHFADGTALDGVCLGP